jgi:ribonuclease G
MATVAREMLISHDNNETQVALLEDQELVELYIERPKRSVVGNVYLGKVSDVLPGMQAAFVDIGLEKNAFLYVDEVVAPEGVEDLPKRDIQQLLRVGQQIMVQVVKGVSKKLPDEERDRLHSIIDGQVPQGTGIIVRTVAQGASNRDLVSDLEFLLRLWKRVKHHSDEALAPEVIYTEMDLALRFVRDVLSEEFRRLTIDDKPTYEKVVSFLKKTSPQLVKRVLLHKDRTPLFEQYALQDTIDGALKRTVPLPNGGHLTIDRTEALIAIDVNTGKFVGKRSLEDTILRTNLEAADEVVRQLRLRDMGGIIVIDFIDMEESANKGLLLQRLGAALDRDRTKTRMSDVSRLGLVEITRKNVTDGLYGVLTEVCPNCNGEGRVVSRQTRRIAAERRMRSILRNGRSDAYLFGLNTETFRLVTEPGLNIAASLRAEMGKQVTIVPDDDVAPTEVRVLIEGRKGIFARR